MECNCAAGEALCVCATQVPTLSHPNLSLQQPLPCQPRAPLPCVIMYAYSPRPSSSRLAPRAQFDWWWNLKCASNISFALQGGCGVAARYHDDPYIALRPRCRAMQHQKQPCVEGESSAAKTLPPLPGLCFSPLTLHFPGVMRPCTSDALNSANPPLRPGSNASHYQVAHGSWQCVSRDDQGGHQGGVLDMARLPLELSA